tara:strand:- start:941 stop:1420 length:480 start_codon:yes stop_codon:yes gene_type:complete
MATLNVTITEELTLNGADRGSVNTLSVSSVTQVYHRIVTCPASQDTTVATFASTADDSTGAAGSIDVGDVKYIRLTNLDSSNAINLSLQVGTTDGGDGAADESATILIAAGRSFVMGATTDAIAVNDANATIDVSLHELESLLVDPSGNAITVEIFIAS